MLMRGVGRRTASLCDSARRAILSPPRFCQRQFGNGVECERGARRNSCERPVLSSDVSPRRHAPPRVRRRFLRRVCCCVWSVTPSAGTVRVRTTHSPIEQRLRSAGRALTD